MGVFELLLLGLGLSMDAVAVSMTNGMTIKRMGIKETLSDALAFGLFQGLMPLIGFLAGSVFAEQISRLGPWIALGVLGFIGAKMLWDGVKKDDEVLCAERRLTLRLLLVQAVATSIDALAVGVGLAALQVHIFLAVSVIAITTFVCSLLAVLIGKQFGDFLGKKAGLLGGCILILIGLKIFLDGILG